MTSQRGKAFADLLHQVTVMEKVRSLDDIAAFLGMDYHTLYARVNGRTPFSAEEIRALIHCIADIRLLSYFTDGSAFVPVERAAPAPLPVHPTLQDGLVREAHNAVLEAADILEVIVGALADSKVDHRDSVQIRRELDHCERALASIRRLLDLKENGNAPQA